MNYFWDLLGGVPGLYPHRVDESNGSNMAGWYNALGLYKAEELGGLPLGGFADAVQAEGGFCGAGCNYPLHIHPLFHECDVYGDGRPTRIAHSNRDLRQPKGSLPTTEKINSQVYRVPWFKHYRPQIIEEQAAAFRKVAENYESLLDSDNCEAEVEGRMSLSARR
jgi:hypothetical protein